MPQPLLQEFLERAAWPAAPLAPRGLRLDLRDPLTAVFVRFARLLARYHRHRVLHLERLGRVLESGRRVILVGNHALDIVDPLLLITRTWERYGRVPRFIAHQNGWFRVPVLREIAAHFRLVPSGSPEEAGAALARDGFLMIFPGANTEAAMRVYREEPYRLKWQNRFGFLRLALEHDAEVLFVAAIGNDEAYYQSRLRTPDRVIALANAGDSTRYRGARLRFGLLGPHLLPGIFPLPVRITHVVSRPLDLGDRVRARYDDGALAALHERVWHQCQRFLDAAVAGREGHTDAVDRLARAGERLLQRCGL
jgi:1-acyl-sn-glycerol-3-phosphate acyltransferase